MKSPQMNELDMLGLIGSGGSGQVFAARDKEGRAWAVKSFDGMAVNRGLISRMVARLETGGWPEGVAEIKSADFESRPARWILPMYGEQEGDGEDSKWNPASLQSYLGEHPGENTWALVKEIGNALAGMHSRRVAHGNLKPGNVFFTEDGKVRLTDWTLGNMPGIIQFGFTDALLYQAPEQLLDPNGYFEEAGYGWDVFAFGVLAYRLLTGKFPRCDQPFSAVAPLPGESCKEGVQADIGQIAEALAKSEQVSWTFEPANGLETKYREWIVKCLHLDPVQRPSTMLEVMAGFERADLRNNYHQAEQRGRKIMFYAGMVTAACFVLGGLCYLTKQQLHVERKERIKEKLFLENKANNAAMERMKANIEKEAAQQAMEYEHDLGLARIEASRLIGDRLFDWAMEKNHRKLPALDGRELRLKRLERFYEDFLTRTGEIANLSDERANVCLQLAEISLAIGDDDAAERRLGEAISGWTSLGMDGTMKMRLGRNALLLALLKQEKEKEDAAQAFVAARTALEKVPKAEVDAARLRQLVAILDFHEAKILAMTGEEDKALAQLMSATKELNELVDLRPDSAVLRSSLAACYVSSATILEGIGQVGDAREVRSLAAAEMLRLLKDDPADIEMQLELAGCYGAMAEAAVLSGDAVAAEKVSNDAMKLLDEILRENPNSILAVTRKAAQLGLRAGLLRDEGKSAEALAAYEEGIKLLERLGADDNGMVTYRLALLWWQKGGMLGFTGKKEEEITLLAKALEAMRGLEARGTERGVPAEELQRSSAYLLGDYAHALELAKKKEKSKEVYREAVSIWETLAKARPQNEEYQQGLEWIRERMKGL